MHHVQAARDHHNAALPQSYRVCLQLPEPQELQNCCASVHEDALAGGAVHYVPKDHQINEDCHDCSTQTAWLEHGFSNLKSIQSFMHNRLLNALMQISLNGLHVLNNEQANAIAEKWLGEKKRRKATPCGMKDVLAYGEKMKN